MILGLTFVIFSIIVLVLLCKQIFWIGKVKSIKRKHVVVTGGSSGIGKAVAVECASRGAHVTIIARNLTKLKQAEEEIKHACIDSQQIIKSVSADVTNEQIENVIKSIEQELPIFMLVNCAGMALFKVFEEMSVDEIKTIINLNLYGTIYPTRAVLPFLKAREDGIVVITSSQGAMLGVFGGGAYISSKYALRGLAEVLYYECKPFNVHVTLSLPSDTDTPGFANEERTKPLETKLICEEGGLLKPEEAAKQIIIDALRDKFISYNINLATFTLTTLAVGMSPPSSLGEIILQVLCMSPLRLISIAYIKSFEKIIERCQKKKVQ